MEEELNILDGSDGIFDEEIQTVTTADDIYRMFYSSFEDNFELPDTLLLQWLIKAVAKYSMELDKISFNKELLEFDVLLDDVVIMTLGEYMKLFYQEREVSRVNKITSMTGSSFSIDAQGITKKYASEELAYVKNNADTMTNNQKPTAYFD